MTKQEPDSTAVRVALWRALHLLVDPPPHVLTDDLALALAAPAGDWRARGDMDAKGTAPFRASIVGRARFIEDVVLDRARDGVLQYVLLGAGLDTFAQRARVPGLRVFEIDRPDPQVWKRERLQALGLPQPVFVPVDFEAGAQWPAQLAAAGFDATRPAVVASAGVSMYLTAEANAATLRDVASFAPGSTFVMSFLLPPELNEAAARAGVDRAREGARASGTPFISFFTPAQILDLGRAAGFRTVQHVSAADITARYFTGRADGLRPPLGAEELLVAST
jgi:methyltransferase (TIGR00027 family)